LIEEGDKVVGRNTRRSGECGWPGMHVDIAGKDTEARVMLDVDGLGAAA
jgi:hypothetical protein